MRKITLLFIIGCLITLLVACSIVSAGSIIGNSDWYGRPHLVNNGGIWPMIYREATSHQPRAAAVFHIRFSNDEGSSWTADDMKLGGSSVTGFPISGYDASDALSDGILIVAPNGDLLVHIASNEVDGGDNPIGRLGTRQWRSTNGGESWSDEGKIANNEVCGAQDYFVSGSDIYISAVIDGGADYSPPYKDALYKSTNNGASWSKVSDITSTTDNTGEAGIEYLGNNTILAVIRDSDNLKTHQRTSTDMGSSWGSLEDISNQVGIFQRARLHKYNGRVYAIGRDWVGGYDTQYTALYYSDDSGDNWHGPFYPDENSYGDAAYCEMIRRTDGVFYLLSYAGTQDDADIMEYVFEEFSAALCDHQGNMIMAGDNYISFGTIFKNA